MSYNIDYNYAESFNS